MTSSRDVVDLRLSSVPPLGLIQVRVGDGRKGGINAALLQEGNHHASLTARERPPRRLPLRVVTPSRRLHQQGRALGSRESKHHSTLQHVVDRTLIAGLERADRHGLSRRASIVEGLGFPPLATLVVPRKRKAEILWVEHYQTNDHAGIKSQGGHSTTLPLLSNKSSWHVVRGQGASGAPAPFFFGSKVPQQGESTSGFSTRS